jgi:hypothetical protein
MPFVLRVLSIVCVCLFAAITSTSAFAATESLINLSWTAPGDDGTVGRATRYDLRYSKSPITATNFAQATPAVGLPTPGPAGTTEHYSIGGLGSGSTYYFAIKTVDDAGNWSALSNVVSRQAPVTGVGDDPGVELALSVPWPSPAQTSTRIAYALPEAGPADVAVFDVSGREVRRVASGWVSAGRGEFVWDLRDGSGRSVSAGLYLVKARLGGRDWTRRVLVVR